MMGCQRLGVILLLSAPLPSCCFILIGSGRIRNCPLRNGVVESSNGDEAESEPEASFFSPNKDHDEQNGDMNRGSVSSVNEYSFFDEAEIYVRAGSGGQGSSTFKKGVHGQNGPPDGGSGGRGGNIVLVVDESLNTLAGLTHAWRPNSFGGSGASYKTSTDGTIRPKSFRAENGVDGGRQFRNGRNGGDTCIRVPPGTVVQDEILLQTDPPQTRYADLGTLTMDAPTLVVARGGEGGEGSAVGGKFGGRGVRRPRLPPEGGERKKLKLILKVVADVALVGVPNSGKSTLLSKVTRAKPKIANYPFTTVIPNLGVWVPPEDGLHSESNDADRKGMSGSGGNGLVLCDVPGLVAGAANGVGLGHAFLRHVERCHVILHLVDATSKDPVADFQMLNRELVRYGTGQLAKMPQVVVVNKIDVFEGKGEDWEKGLKTKLSREQLQEALTEALPHSRLMWMSAKEKEGVDELMLRMRGFVSKVKSVAKQS